MAGLSSGRGRGRRTGALGRNSRGAGPRPPAPRRPGLSATCALFLAVLGVAGCELSDRSLTEPESRVVAEVYVLLNGEDTKIRAFLHRTVDSGDSRSVDGARIVLQPGEKEEVELRNMAREACVLGAADGAAVELPTGEGSCYGLEPQNLEAFDPEDEVTARIELPGGGLLTGRTTLPGSIRLRTPPPGTDACYLPPDQVLPLTWTRSPGTWAYSAETLIFGLREALGKSVEIPSDPLFLLGLALSDADTTLTFPSEVGVFDRLDLDRGLTLALQDGLPAGTSATITVAALDRNWVNWARGGDFNPSGQVRVPSLHGRGTGVLAAANRRSFRVNTRGPELPSCLAGVVVGDAGVASPTQGPFAVHRSPSPRNR